MKDKSPNIRRPPEYTYGYHDGYRDGYSKALEDLQIKKEVPSWHPKEGAECDNCGADKRYCDACRHRPGIYDERKWEARED